MEDIFGRYAVIAFGAIFAAIVTGFFSFMNLVVSKEQKVSEFRQEWINSLRDSVSSYISALAYLSLLQKHHLESDSDKSQYSMTRDVEEIYAKVNESYNDIIFRINPDEKDKKGKKINDEFLHTLSETRALYNKGKYAEARLFSDQLRSKTKPLLKYEWKRVRSGEKNYIRAKWLSVGTLLLGVGLAILSLYLIWAATNTPGAPLT